jgi:DNA processing protein
LADNNINKINIEKMYACWLDCIYWISSETKYRLLEKAGSVQNIYNMTDEEITQTAGESNLKRIKEQKLRCQPQRAVEYLASKGIKYTYCRDKDFPKKLKDIPDPPFGLFYMGELPDGEVPTVAIIGARKCSDYGKYMAEKFATGFGKNKINVISGMAYGIDGISQRAAIDAGTKSYGVLGSGVDVIYPKSNAKLYNDLIQMGGVISEYPPGMEARPSLFPPRNRIISGLSDVVLVVEAREKSGTLITVDMALEQGREVYAVPGRCSDQLSMGCNILLRQGAMVATSYQDIIDDMKWQIKSVKRKVRKTADLSPNADEVYTILDVLPMTQDDIIERLKEKGITLGLPAMCQALLELELKGYAIRENGQYRKSPK